MPAADEVYRLQTDDDADCRFFRAAVYGDARPRKGSMQGTYVFAPSGELLGRLNSLHADKVVAMLTAALEKWDALEDGRRWLTERSGLEPEHRWEDSYPEGGLVLMRTARDVPGEDPAAEPLRPFNRGQVWFSAAEARRWLPEKIAAGETHEISDDLLLRLACFHLVDNVRGQTIPFAPEEIEGKIAVTVESVSDGVASLSIRGETAAMALGPWLLGDNYWKPKREWPRVVGTTVVGVARFDIEANRFTLFDLVALGDRDGRTGFNGRARERSSHGAPIGFVFRLAPATLRVAPTFINLYNADWVRHPGG